MIPLLSRVLGKIRNWQLNAPLRRAQARGHKVVVFNAVNGFHYDYFEPLLRHLREDARICWWIVTYENSDGPETLRVRGIPGNKILVTDSAIELKCVDAFISPSTFTAVPGCPCERIQLFHGLAGWGSSKSGDPQMLSLEKFNRLFVAGPHMERTIRDHYLAGHPDTVLYPIGYPKTDTLFNGTHRRDTIVQRYGLDPGKPLVMYAPSWEKSASWHTSGAIILETLAKLDASILIKPHPNCLTPNPHLTGGIDWAKWLTEFCRVHSNCRAVRESDANPYLVAADVLVTDVSGVGFEYLLLNKPIVYWDCPEFFTAFGTTGIEYHGRRAGEIVTTPEQLRDAIQRALDNPSHRKQVRAEVAGELLYNPGHATEPAVNTTVEILGLKR